MNPLKKDASTRTKEEIEAIRHVYLDLDHGGFEALEAIENSSVVPKPNYVLNSSPEKHQVVWKVEGMNLEEADSLLHAMAREFSGDPAATDATRRTTSKLETLPDILGVASGVYLDST